MPHYDETLTGSTLPLALLQTARRMGGKAPILEDQNREPIGYDRLILGAQVLGRVFAGQTAQRAKRSACCCRTSMPLR
jgi:acyl-[acyl-carrier-protein]-phospholipid O-acyltransferase/long-chain-fatty-acid--[acyl-carrier-protein] ligase